MTDAETSALTAALSVFGPDMAELHEASVLLFRNAQELSIHVVIVLTKHAGRGAETVWRVSHPERESRVHSGTSVSLVQLLEEAALPELGTAEQVRLVLNRPRDHASRDQPPEDVLPILCPRPCGQVVVELRSITAAPGCRVVVVLLGPLGVASMTLRERRVIRPVRGKYAKVYPVNTISLRQAEAKYGVPHNTVSGWVASGIVRVARRPETRGQSLLVFRS